MNKEKRNKIFKVLISIIFIIVAILIGKLVYDDTWPKDFSQEEQVYYTEIASRAWNEGLKSIAGQMEANNYLNSYYSQKGEMVSISFNAIERNMIIIESSKKGRLYFCFTDEGVDIHYKRGSFILSIFLVIAVPIVLNIMIFIVLAVLYTVVKDSINLKKMKKESKKEINLRNYSEGVDFVVDKKGL